MQYGSCQRVAFAGLVIGFILCVTGAIAPFWQEGNIEVNTIAKIFGETLPFIGDLKVVSMNGGLWWYCVEILSEKKCELYNFSEDGINVEWIIRIAAVKNVLLTLVCALVALCRSCCCTGGKTICHGIVAFFAGGSGIVALALFAATCHDGFGIKMMMNNYDWAFYIYAVGTAMVTFVSFMLCFASPNNPLTPVIINSMHNVMPNRQYTLMSDDRVQLTPQQEINEPRIIYPQDHRY